MVVVVVVDVVAFSDLRSVIRGLSVVNSLPSIMFWAPHDEIAPIIFLQGLQLAFTVRRNGFCLASST